MGKRFNITGSCDPVLHYMADISVQLGQIKEMVDLGDYFTINRARQYGKTTTLIALEDYLKDEYQIIRLDFQRLQETDYRDTESFVRGFSRLVYKALRRKKIPENIRKKLSGFFDGTVSYAVFDDLFDVFEEWCEISDKPLVLMIDEVDAAANYQPFLDLLSQLRANYLDRKNHPTFQSVILAGVYDIKNLKRRFVGEKDHQENSPWNISAKFLVDMSFSAAQIAGMLQEYEKDHKTGMDVDAIAQLIYDYTSGYPYLVSDLCKIMDEEISVKLYSNKFSAWTKEGVAEAVRRILLEKNTLFESLTDKVNRYPLLRELLYSMLMNGTSIANSPDNEAIDIAMMFGFVKASEQGIVISNRIFETRLYNLFLSESDVKKEEIYRRGDLEKIEFNQDNGLYMRMILEGFVFTFDDLYGDQPQKFLEEDGRRFFLLFLRPIINGTGNYYIEARTRNQERTDIIVDYHGKQYVIELKLWRGDAYQTRGEKQLAEYLDYYHLEKGYM
ncbi:MAG: AAA-like domain-containing protein, partial [Lachnospiraceae bacterium]|nr:AAA-like domain-containing protein [Lachnospiraceae bacterium]